MDDKLTQLQNIMQRTQQSLNSLAKIVSCVALALGAVTQIQADDAKKADAAGTWTWSTPARGGGEPRKSTLKLKVDGDKVTGTLTLPGRPGSESRDVEIKEAKLKGDEISFTTSFQRGDNSVTTKYNGKISGDTIKGKIEAPGRDGNTVTRDWDAKRESEKK